MTIFVPVIGYMLLLNDYVVEYLSLSNELIVGGESEGTSAEPITDSFDRLRLIYFGLIFVGAASFMFKVLCPPEILQSENEYAFVGVELDIMTSERFADAKERLSNWPGSVPQKLKGKIDQVRGLKLSEALHSAGAIYTSDKSGALVWEDWINRNRAAISEVLSIQFDVLNQSKLIWRACILSFYVLGFSIVLWPSASVFRQILITTLK